MFFLVIIAILLHGALALDARCYSYECSQKSTTDSETLTQPTRPTSTHTYGNSTTVPQPTGGACTGYWLENIKHQGIASFNSNSTHLAFSQNSTYQVFRNVKDYGAVGDGRTDDTAAIQRAISEGNRCAPGVCESSTTTPAVVYFPAGTYLITSSIIDYYYTQVSLLALKHCL